MFGSFLPSALGWFGSHQSLLGYRSRHCHGINYIVSVDSRESLQRTAACMRGGIKNGTAFFGLCWKQPTNQAPCHIQPPKNLFLSIFLAESCGCRSEHEIGCEASGSKNAIRRAQRWDAPHRGAVPPAFGGDGAFRGTKTPANRASPAKRMLRTER